MLHISRFIGMDMFGVYDTDDDSESEAYYTLLVDAAIAGVDILGVEKRFSPKLGRIVIDDIYPYQPAEAKTPLQLKTKMVRNVDIRTFRDYITRISWDSDKITEPVVLRLSDFGHRIASKVFYGAGDSGRHDITLVLDDSLKVRSSSFRLTDSDACLGPDGVGVVFDVREVTDIEIVRHVYRTVFAYTSTRFDCILDSPERKNKMLKSWYDVRR